MTLTDSARRKPGANATRPNMAAEFVKTLRVVSTIVRATDQRADDLLADVISGLFAGSNKSARDIVLGALCDKVIEEDDLFFTLGEVWDEPTDATDLSSVVKDAIGQGLDGESLAWGLIGLESQRHLKLVWQQANRVASSTGVKDPSDLLGFGWMGLRLALRNYDPTQYAFSTYACIRINGAIRDGIRREGPVPKRLTTYVRKVASVEESLLQSLGRPPTHNEVLERVGGTLEQLKIAKRCAPTASLDALGDERNSDDTRWAVLDTEPEPGEAATTSVCAQAVSEALAKLPREEAEAVRLLHLEGCGIAEARERSGATARQLRQRAAKGRAKLAEELSEWADVIS